ncbi:MAG: hypothetical protein GW942_02605 [Candidatus Pacebacteria bacterium]|nr:hypothetical protein [Candidatus Paceibacterota bacterium]
MHARKREHIEGIHGSESASNGWRDIENKFEVELGIKFPNIFPKIKNDGKEIKREFINGTNLHDVLKRSKVPISVGLNATLVVVEQLKEIYESGYIVGDRNGYNIFLQGLDSVNDYNEASEYPVRQTDVEDMFVQQVENNRLSSDNWDLLINSCITLLINIREALNLRINLDRDSDIPYMNLFYLVEDKIDDFTDKLGTPGEGESLFSDLESFLNELLKSV